MEYNEQEAIKYIRSKMPAEALADVNDDEILNVIDIIFDYYEDNGFLDLDLDMDDDEELDVDSLVAYVKKMIAKDKNSPLRTDDIEAIVVAELEYEDSIDEF